MATRIRSIHVAFVATLSILVAGGCTHTVQIDAPEEAVAVDLTLHVQHVVNVRVADASH